MTGKALPQKRLGTKEAKIFKNLLAEVKAFKVFTDQKKLGETRLNALLMHHLRVQAIAMENTNIVPAKFVGETFRPEFMLKGSGKYPICAIECKKLNDQYAKARWKEGLSQSLLYAHYYKAVIYVLFDYSKGSKYAAAFGRGNRVESRFAKELREMANVYIVAIKPKEV
jgi:hypothetical protein